MDAIEYVLRIILLLVGFCALLFLTYVTTRYIGQRQMKSMRGKNISILETVMLGSDKRLHLVKAGNSYILIASTSKSVEFLANVDLDTAEEEETTGPENDARFDFRTILDKYAGMYRAKKEKRVVVREENPAEKQDEPKFRSNLDKLRTIVYKSKNIKSKEDGVDVTNDK
jgi:flagellar biogenesis protein FliO